MSQNTRYAAYLVGLLFAVTVGYSGMVIYNNKHRHDGSHFSLISFLKGKGAAVSPLKDSTSSRQTAERLNQYNAAQADALPEPSIDNDRRQAILDFYSDYLANKQSGISQAPTVAKYGTAKLAAQDYAVKQDYDPFLCGFSLPVSAAITSSYSTDDTTYVELEFSDSTGPLAKSQATLLSQDGKIFIDSIGCLGTDN